MEEDEAVERVENSRPDNYFKLLIATEASTNGLRQDNGELQYNTRSDLILIVPFGTKLEGTIFDFFRAVNVLEFKSQGDKFNLTDSPLQTD